MNISTAVSVAAVTVNTGDYREYSFLGTGSLTVANNFYIYDMWGADFQPTLTVGGQFQTDPTFSDARATIKFGSSSAYTNGDTFTGGILNYNNWFLDIEGNSTTFGGTLMSEGYMPFWNFGSTNFAQTKIGGTGDTLLAGTTLSLQYGGVIDFTTVQNFSNVSSVTINGGLLKLDAAGNTFPTYANGFVVASGALAIVGDTSLGTDDSNGITLGSAYNFGTLMGHASNSAGNYITRPITLAGNGGVFATWSTFDSADNMNLATTISGSGALVKTGNYALYLRNAGSGTTSSYTGGTVVAGGLLYVESTRSLGTGNASIPFAGGADLALTAAGNLNAGATVYTGSLLGLIPTATSGLMPSINYAPAGILEIDSNFAIPTIDPNSTGVIALGNINLTTPITSMGNCFLGSDDYGTYSATTLAAGTGNVYRIGGTSGQGYYYQTVFNTSDPSNVGVLIGNNDVLFYQGGAKIYDVMTYTGATTVDWNMSSFGNPFNTPVQAVMQVGGSPLGSTTGAVNLNMGALYVSNDGNNGQAIVKGALNVSGMGDIAVQSNSMTSNNTTITFASLNLVDRGMLVVSGVNGLLGSTGTTAEQVFFTTPPTVTNGMLDPHIVSGYNVNTGDFTTYSATYGVQKATYVPLPVSGGTGVEITQASSPTTITGNVDVWALQASAAVTGSGNTITLESGGLILTGATAALNYNTNFNFGPSGTGEAVIYSNTGFTSNGGDAPYSPHISGTITAVGLTKGGPDTLVISGINAATLTGEVVIDEGTLFAASDAALGAPGNLICINGGCLDTFDSTTIAHTITVGPNGGTLEDYSGAVTGVIEDDPNYAPGGAGQHAGALNFGSAISLRAVNTFTGGAIVTASIRLDVTGNVGQGNITVEGGGSISDFTGLGWSTPGRVSLLGYNRTQIAFEGGGTGQTYAFGSLEGQGDVVDGGYEQPSTATLQIGSDNTSTDFYGRVYDMVFDGSATGLSLVKEGTGTLTMWGDNAWHGPTTINGGTLTMNGSLSNGTSTVGAITINTGGTLDGDGTVQRNVSVTSGGTLSGSLATNSVTVTAGGTVNMTGATINGNLVSSGLGSSVTLANSTVNGLLRLGLTPAATVGSTFTGSGDTINGNVDVYHGSTFTGANETINDGGGTMIIGGANGAATFTGTNTINNAGYIYVENGTVSGTNNIAATAGLWLNPYGYGPASLTGTNTVTAPYFVMDQTGVNYSANALVSGTNTFNAAVYMYGGTLSGNNTINGNVNGGLTTAAGSNAVIVPHNGASAGTLTINGNVSLDHSTALNFNLGTPGTVGSGINDLIDVTGNLSLDGTLNVTGLTGFTTGTYTLFTYTGMLTEPSGPLTLGTMPIGMGYTYTIDTSTTGQVNLDVVLPWAPGDTNRDGLLNSLDIDAIYHNFGAPSTSQWKVDGDGNVVGQGDVTYELHTYFHTNYGDANLDTKTDFSDFQVLLDHWQVSGPTIGWAQGDFNGSYSVDFLDFQTLLDYWNPGGWSFAPAQTPEPASLTLLLLGGLALLRRKK